MKKAKTLLQTTVLACFTLFIFTGCEEKKEENPFIPLENTTEIFTQTNTSKQKEKQSKFKIKKENVNKEVAAVSEMTTDTFTLSDIQQNQHKLTISNKKMSFHDISQPIVIINLFSTWYSPCCGEIPYLTDLQKKYKKSLFIAGVLVNDKQDNTILKEFIDTYHINYFISNSTQNNAFAKKVVKELQLPENFPIPLTIIYKEGNYYTHYEGAVPIEMIDHDIQEAIKYKGL